MRLKNDMHSGKVFETSGRALTAANMSWNQFFKNFQTSSKALCDCKEEDVLDVPAASNSIPIMKWTEYFCDNLQRVVGDWKIPI